MDILIDGNRDLAFADPGATLGEIMDQLGEWLARNGRAIVEITLDGTTLDAQARERLRGSKVDSHQTLDLTTLCPAELSLSTLRNLLPHVGPLGEALIAAARCFQKGDLPRGFALLRNSATGLQVTMDTLTKVSQLQGIDLGKLPVGGKTGLDVLNHLREKLREVQNALMNQDTVTLADMSEYELAPSMKDWEEIIRKLESEIQAPK